MARVSLAVEAGWYHEAQPSSLAGAGAFLVMYDAYAPIYDAIGQARFGAAMAERSLHWLAGHGCRPGRVLDLACGTGAAALVFAAAGCEVVGVDRSARMLEIARGRARDAGADVTFVQGDIRELFVGDQRPYGRSIERPDNDQSLDEDCRSPFVIGHSSFDLVTCFYDSLNYLAEDGDLDRVFAGVARALRPGGFAIFDMNTAAEYATWDERDVVTHDGRDILVYNKLSYDAAARLARGRIVWFVREIERWWRGEETHTQRAWADAEVRAALAGAGLALEARLDAQWSPPREGATRLVYVARKP
jgi:SAM-dependent methyltransferase